MGFLLPFFVTPLVGVNYFLITGERINGFSTTRRRRNRLAKIKPKPYRTRITYLCTVYSGARALTYLRRQTGIDPTVMIMTTPL